MRLVVMEVRDEYYFLAPSMTNSSIKALHLQRREGGRVGR